MKKNNLMFSHTNYDFFGKKNKNKVIEKDFSHKYISRLYIL